MEPTKTKEVLVLEKKIDTVTAVSKTISVKNDDDLIKAGEVRKQIKDYLKSVTEEKEKVTKPMNAALKIVRGWFSPMEDKCEDAVKEIGAKMQIYQEDVEMKRRKAEDEARRKEEEALAKLNEGKITEKQAVKEIAKIENKLEKAPEVITKTDSFHQRVDRKVRFTDLSSLSLEDVMLLVKGGYLTWDEVRARRDALSGTLTIGVEVYEQKSLI